MAEKVLKEKTQISSTSYIDEKGRFCVIKRCIKEFPKFVDTYVEIPPYSIDKETGEFLNKSAVPILKKGEPFNFYEKIQSYKADCDIYSILAKFAITGDSSLINQRAVSYGDVFDVPDNINDFTQLTEHQQEQLKQFTKEQVKTILNENASSNELNSLVADLVKAEMVKQGYKFESKEEVKE